VERFEGFEVLYTDSSVQEQFMGCAFVHFKSNTITSFNANSKSSSLTAELTALKKAIDFANSKNFVKVAILTDSLSKHGKKSCVSNCIALDILKK